MGATIGSLIDATTTKDEDLPKKYARRNIANTYVWTADGGFYEESTQISEVSLESKSGSYFFKSKATGGRHFIDPRFHQNWHGMRSTGLNRGAYHFYYADEDPRAQAKHFIATVGKLRPKYLPPGLDIEISDHADEKKIIEGTLIWLETVEKELGRRPVLYTNLSFGDRDLKDARLSKYPLWISEYNKQVRSVPAPWKKLGWTIWQQSPKGIVQGVSGDVDMNVFNGMLEDLEAFIADSRAN